MMIENEFLIMEMATVSHMALSHWGHKAQVLKAVEEMSELSVKLCKRLNSGKATNEEVIDEIADVSIMIFQLRSLFGEERVDNQIAAKLTRTRTRIIELQSKADGPDKC